MLLRKKAIIDTMNDGLKKIAQTEHLRHGCFDNFVVNLSGTITAHCLFTKKPSIKVQRILDAQIELF
ncbi:hypothetical protein JCM15908A_12640 [Prevotella dentasini JCM 15908]